MRWLAEAFVASLKEGAVMNGMNVPIGVAGLILFRVAILDGVGLVLLIEGTVLMLIGGVMEFGTTASTRRLANLFQKKSEWKDYDYKKSQRRAMVFTLTGLVLFLESMLFAVFML